MPAFPTPSFAFFRRNTHTRSAYSFRSQVWIAIQYLGNATCADLILGVRLICFNGAAWTYGVQEMKVEGMPARITSPARTVVDCFKFQRLIGREAAMEAHTGGAARREGDHGFSEAYACRSWLFA